MRGGRGDPSPLGGIFLSNSTEPTVVVQKAYDWALWIIPKVEKFPKSYRFSIGQSLVTASIELLLNPSGRDLPGAAFVVPGMRSAAWAMPGPVGGNRFHPRRFRECQLRFRVCRSRRRDVLSLPGVKQQVDPGFLVAPEANVSPGWTKGWRSMLNCSYLRIKAFPLNLTVRWPMIQLSLFLPPQTT